jgi:hypothetical protein
MREERTVPPGKPRPRRVFAPDLEGLEQLRLLNAAPVGVAVPAPQHASSQALISVDQKPGTVGTPVGVARGGDGFICGGGAYAPGAAAFTAAGAQAGFSAVDDATNSGRASSGFVNLSSGGFSIINGAINLGAPNPGSISGSGLSTMNGAVNLDAVGFASGGGGYTMIAMTPAPYQGAGGDG